MDWARLVSLDISSPILFTCLSVSLADNLMIAQYQSSSCLVVSFESST